MMSRAYIPPFWEQFFLFRALAHELLRRNNGVIVLDMESMDCTDTPILARPVEDGMEFTICKGETLH